MLILLLLGSALALAFANGANDNFKAAATLYGSRAVDYEGARRLATAAQLSGSVASVLLASQLLEAFSGKGLVPTSVVGNPVFLGSVGTADTDARLPYHRHVGVKHDSHRALRFPEGIDPAPGENNEPEVAITRDVHGGLIHCRLDKKFAESSEYINMRELGIRLESRLWMQIFRNCCICFFSF